MVMTFIITALYFYTPVALANLGANLSYFFPVIPLFKDIKAPVDFGLTYKGNRLVGEHKTIGNFLFGVLFGLLMGILKNLYVDKYMDGYILININFTNTIFLYSLMSFGALLGDIVKSIAKRLLNRPAHSAWMPFDQIDHSIGSLLLASIFFPIPFSTAITIVSLGLFLHLLYNLIGYKLNIRDVPY